MAITDLAAALERSSFPPELAQDAFLRRCIEANCQLGTADEAERLAWFASLPEEAAIPLHLRLLAIEKLENWDVPEPRESVWGRWMPPAPREPESSRGAIQRHIPSLLSWASGDLSTKAKHLEAAHGSEAPMDELVATLRDVSKALNARISALRQLDAKGQQSSATVANLCREILLDPLNPAQLRVEARKAILNHLSREEAFAQINQALLGGSAQEKQRAVEHIGRMPGTDAQNKLLELGRLFYAGNLDPVVWVEMLEIAHRKDEKFGLWRKILERWDAGLDQESDPLIIYKTALQGGDPAAGRRTFYTNPQSQCLRCHQLNGQGGLLGPDLSGIGKRSTREELIQSLLLPSAKIADGYGIVSLALHSGKTLTGTLRRQTPQEIALLVEDSLRTLPTSAIKELTPPLSPMPPMGTMLTLRELRDLVAFLQALK
jgi:putative heme-binding domain-containing protein